MKKYYLIGIQFLVVFSLISCLKDKNIEDQRYGLRGLEDIKLIELTGSPSDAIGLVASDLDTNFTLVTLHLNSDQPAQNDITITLVPDAVVLDTFNSVNTTSYIVPPATAYTLDNLNVTIPAGSRDGVLKVTLKPNNLSGADYAFAFTIGSISDPGFVASKNYKSIVAVVVVKNIYDGDYDVSGWFFHPSVGREIHEVKSLSTVSGIRSEGTVGDLGSPFQFDVVDNSLINWASDAFTSSNFMVEDNPGNTNYSSASNETHVPGDAVYNKTIYNNTYDPATKTFYFHYGYVNGAVAGEVAYTRQIYEKWVKIP